MAVTFVLFSLAYGLACSGLAVYNLAGCCIRPLAVTRSFAGGKLLLIAIFLTGDVLVGGLFATMVTPTLRTGVWRQLAAGDGWQEICLLLLAVALPSCLCWRAVRNRLPLVCGVACGSLFVYWRVFLLACAGA